MVNHCEANMAFRQAGMQYYPFGMQMPGRSYTSSNSYRYGYQGSEKDDEITDVACAHYSTYFRELDTRLIRWWSPDPVFQPWQGPYNAMDNNPILFNDPLGDWKSKTNDDGTISYSPEEGDNFETFTDQYQTSKEDATDIFTQAGLEDYLPKTETQDRKFLGIKVGEKEVTTYETFKDSETSFNTENLLKLNTDSKYSTPDTKSNHLQTMLKMSSVKNIHMIRLTDYFSIPTQTGWGSQSGLGFKGAFKIDDVKIPFRLAAFTFFERKGSDIRTTPTLKVLVDTDIWEFQMYHATYQYPGLTISFTNNSNNYSRDKLESYFGW